MNNNHIFVLKPGELNLADLDKLKQGNYQLKLADCAINNILNSREYLEQEIAKNTKIYGVNTGFGLLANKKIDDQDLNQLQENLILSHATGVGNYFNQEITRIILVLKINSLAMGYSGVKLATIEELINLYNNNTLPCIPEKGSVGASGDLAPLAHLIAPLLGFGEMYDQDKIIPAEQWLKNNNKTKFNFVSKEGLALLNGTQVTTALAVYNILAIAQLFEAAINIGALSVDALGGSRMPFNNLISKVRNQPGQKYIADKLYNLLEGSEILESHNNHNCPKVQDPYSIRCQPQVVGACWQQFEFSKQVIENEINSVTDNPLIFSREELILFGGNFHAEPIGFAVDNLALVLAELGSLSERRTALLVDPHFSGLPGFLVKNSGLNSGFMIAQVTAASLVSENKALATPTVIDSIPTSANQEDHVSMATYGARRLGSMVDNLANIIGIELLSAAQGIDFRRPLKSSHKLETIITALREQVSFYENDRFFHSDLIKASEFVKSYQF
ncbi:MAG: histidine ammonia-lyase [Gammaproteobacteria bacterium]|nr:histidine ammonia-lyase [Gammaproteobacteria bacterium]